jgi:S1 RNA binding domain
LIVHRILKDVLQNSAEKLDGEVPVGCSESALARVRDILAAPALNKSGSFDSAPDMSLSAATRDTDPAAERRHNEAHGASRGLAQYQESAPEGRKKDHADEQSPLTSRPSPWSKRRDHEHQKSLQPLTGPISLEELHAIAEESSQSERRADDAERELMEWKKVKFMERRIGEDFDGLIISVTKFGFFVELTDLFIEGLVPLNTLGDGGNYDRFVYHENTREIIGQRTHKTYRLGDRVRVLVDRIDPVEKKIQFAVLEEPAPSARRKKR